MALASMVFTTAFGLALLNAMVGLEKQPGQATLVSPLSASGALTLALNAAGLPSRTQEELVKALTQAGSVTGNGGPQETAVNDELMKLMAVIPSQGSNLDTGEKSILANALWTRKGVSVKQSYADAMLKMFQAQVQVANSVDDVNAWVKDVTQGLIPNLLSPGTPFDVVLTNALYFKGKWLYRFKETDTEPRTFTTAKGEKKQVSMMRKEFDEDSLLTAQVPGKFKAVRLPYRSGNFSAIAVLPDSATTKPEPLLPILMPGSAGSSVFAPLGVGSRRYTPGKDSTWQRSGRLAVVMPRFKLRARMSLVDPLKKMGVQAAFSDSAADFSRADADPRAPFYVSDVVQEVVLNVDEEGTEAAAATGVIMMATAMPVMLEPPPEIVFDRPFLFALVHDDTGTILIMAVVRDPPPADDRPAGSQGPSPPTRITGRPFGLGRRIM